MGTTGLASKIKDGDWVSVRQAIAKLSTKLGPKSHPTYAGLTLTGLTATRLIASDADDALVSTDLASWVTQTANQVLVADDADGTITLSLPQDIHTGASPEFTNLTLSSTMTFLSAGPITVGSIIAVGNDWWFENAVNTGDIKFFTTNGDVIATRFVGDTLVTGGGTNPLVLDADVSGHTAERVLTLTVNDADRSLFVYGNTTLNQDVHTAASPTFVALNFDLAAGIDYRFADRVGALALESIGAGNNCVWEQFSSDGDGTDSVTFNIFAQGTVESVAAASLLQTGYNTGDNTAFRIWSVKIGVGTARHIDIYTEANTNQLRLHTNGNVGVGTAAPNAPLEVKGAKPAGNIGGFQSGMFHVTGSGTAQYSNSVITGHSAYGGNTQLWYLGSTSSGNDDIAFINRQNAPIHFYTNNTSKMTIDAAGNVGINETAPQDKLEVNGSILVKSKLKLVQDDGNEYISSLSDGYVDYGATTAHRFNNDISFTTSKGIRQGTSDASDDQSTYLAGGGAFGNSRGACLVCYGNEVGEAPGKLYLYGGNVANGDIILNVENSERGRFRAEGLLVVGEIENSKSKRTLIGGYAIKLTNKTGANSVAGELVNAHTSVENAVEQTAVDDTIPIGAFLESGIADGSEAWVVVGGIAQVLVDGSTTVAVGDWVKVSSNDAGRVESSGSEAPGVNHFREVGHTLEAGGNNELIKVAMHFN